MDRLPLIAGNWKMNKTYQEAEELLNGLVKGIDNNLEDREVLICPPFPFIDLAVKLTEKTPIKVGAQNLFWEEEGAFTGEVSGKMLNSIGCKYVIVGHSERREYFQENDVLLSKKLKIALNNNLVPILCVGENLPQREAGQEKDVVKSQIINALDGFIAEEIKKMVIAYEPIWAIGTGKTATPEQAQEMHNFIRLTIADKYGFDSAEEVRILYGGSVKPDNIDQLMSQMDIDGALVGGASLKAESFLRIINFQ